MLFRLLGPLTLDGCRSTTAIAGGRDRVVLATLLINANQVVSVDTLVDAVWPVEPPSTARAQVHSCVSRLRNTLASDRDVIHTHTAGYRVNLDSEQLDVAQFAEHVAAARKADAEGQPVQASDLYRSGLAFWQGPPLSNVDSLAVRAAAARWEEQRATALEECLDLELRLGREREVLGELTDLVARFPLRERLRGQLMTTLYRMGRQADALTVYRTGRELMTEELGIEPGDDLARLHQQILTKHSDLRVAGDPVQRRVTPHTLPRDLSDFTGREAIVDQLCAVSLAASGPPVVIAIDGMAGVGKTTLTLHVAHMLSGSFPDARLYLDLHGQSDRTPLDTATAIGSLLRQLGQPGDRVPESLEGRISLWRSELAGRQVLVVLDNAANTDQIASLLPSSAGCLTLVTSRRRLIGLDGAHHVALDVLTDDEALDMLQRIAGNRVRTAPADAAEVVRMCGNLALALRLAAARLVHRPAWAVSDLANLLRRSRLAHSSVDLPADGRSIEHAFALSYDQLTSGAQRLFRLLGLHPGPDFDWRAASTLSGLSEDDTQTLLDELVDTHLVEEPTPERYRLHDLLRDYAERVSNRVDPQEDQDAALGREIDYYLHSTISATERFEVSTPEYPTETGKPSVQTVSFDDADTALHWLDTEYQNVLELIRRTAKRDWHLPTCLLARAIWRHQYSTGNHDDSLAVHELAMRAATLMGDDGAVAQILNYRAAIHYHFGRSKQALNDLQEAVRLARASGYRKTEGAALNNQIRVLVREGRYAEARVAGQAAAEIFVQIGQPLLASLARCCDTATIDQLMHHHTEAVAAWRAHIRLSRQYNNDFHYALAMIHLGVAELHRGRARVAARMLRRSMGFGRYVSKLILAEAMNHLGSALRELGEFDEALRWHAEALDLAEKFTDKAVESEVRICLGRTLRAVGDHAGALGQHRQALAIAEQARLPLEEARALEGIAGIVEATDSTAGTEYWRRALSLYERLGLPEKDTIRQHLDG